jgi:methanethiol S-methyltransferase
MTEKPSRVGGYVALAYAVSCYTVFLAVLSYLVLFTVGSFVPKTVNDGPSLPVLPALLIDCALMLLFAVQHTIMARPAFKQRWTRLVPVAAERSTFVLVASACVALLLLGWVPLPGELWHAQNASLAALLWSVCAGGWLLLLLSTFLIDHFELFGLKQGWLRARRTEPAETAFKQPALYRVVRHPMMLGFLLGLWATPRMTCSHFVLAAGMTLYILVGVRFEERDLLLRYGDSYQRYQQRVPKLMPGWRARPGPSGKSALESTQH